MVVGPRGSRNCRRRTVKVGMEEWRGVGMRCSEEGRVIYLEKKGTRSSRGCPGEGVGNPWWGRNEWEIYRARRANSFGLSIADHSSSNVRIL